MELVPLIVSLLVFNNIELFYTHEYKLGPHWIANDSDGLLDLCCYSMSEFAYDSDSDGLLDLSSYNMDDLPCKVSAIAKSYIIINTMIEFPGRKKLSRAIYVLISLFL